MGELTTIARLDGGTTAFPEVDVPDVDAWCGSIAEEFGLLVAPGNACFGVPGRVRINLGLRPETRAQAFPLLAQALMKLHRGASHQQVGRAMMGLLQVPSRAVRGSGGP